MIEVATKNRESEERQQEKVETNDDLLLEKEFFPTRQIEENTEPESNSFPNRMKNRPTDGVFRFGELHKADLVGADLSGYFVEEKNGNVIKIEALIQTEDEDRILSVFNGSMMMSEAGKEMFSKHVAKGKSLETRFSADDDLNDKLNKIIDSYATPSLKSVTERDYSGLKLEAVTLPTTKDEYANLAEFFGLASEKGLKDQLETTRTIDDNRHVHLDNEGVTKDKDAIKESSNHPPATKNNTQEQDVFDYQKRREDHAFQSAEESENSESRVSEKRGKTTTKADFFGYKILGLPSI